MLEALAEAAIQVLLGLLLNAWNVEDSRADSGIVHSLHSILIKKEVTNGRIYNWGTDKNKFEKELDYLIVYIQFLCLFL